MADAELVGDFRKALKARDRSSLNALAARMLEQRLPLGGQWFSVAQVLVRTGELRLATEAAERAEAESGGSDKARFELAHIYSLVGRQNDAIEILAAIAQGQPNQPQIDHLLGTCALEVGDFALARNAFERVLAVWPGSGATWLSLAALPAEDDEPLLDRLNAARTAVTATPADSQARWHYARGAILDRLDQIDQAFLAFSEGAKLVKTVRSYDPDADQREAERLAGDFDRAAIDHLAGQVGADTSRPILVTGLPRSGTTLVEQILASRSEVAGGGELPFGSILSREVGGHSLEQLEAFVSTQGADSLAQLYLHLGDQQFGAAVRFVDKGLAASRQLGVLASALPQARIIWLRRDPLDCAWSCFRTFFSQGIEWSWSLTDIAAHFRAEDRLFAHWGRVLSDRLLPISYEDLVADPQTQTARMLSHLGLVGEPASGAVHETRRAVTTSSLAQVRQPIYQTAMGAARRYRKHLQPFVVAYQAEGPGEGS